MHGRTCVCSVPVTRKLASGVKCRSVTRPAWHSSTAAHCQAAPAKDSSAQMQTVQSKDADAMKQPSAEHSTRVTCTAQVHDMLARAAQLQHCKMPLYRCSEKCCHDDMMTAVSWQSLDHFCHWHFMKEKFCNGVKELQAKNGLCVAAIVLECQQAHLITVSSQCSYVTTAGRRPDVHKSISCGSCCP